MARINLRYPDALRWIAFNDEPTIDDPFEIADLISVTMLAEISGRTPLTVARDVVAVRHLDTQRRHGSTALHLK